MNRLPVEKIERVLKALAEGNSIAATSRMEDVAPNTVKNVMLKGAEVCRAIHDEHVRNLDVRRIECDELETYVYARRANVPYAKNPPPGAGPVHLWSAVCAESRLIIAYHLGGRGRQDAEVFLGDVASRVNGMLRVATDRLKSYPSAIAAVFQDSAGHVQVGRIKVPDGRGGHHLVELVPDGWGTTAHVERVNLNFRMWCSPLRRNTIAFAKSRETLEARVDIAVFHYNWCHTHRELKTTPAAAGLGTGPRPEGQWRRVADLVYNSYPAPGPRGPYQKAQSEGEDAPTAPAESGNRRQGGKYYRYIGCPNCDCHHLVKKGKRQGGKQEYQCVACGYRFAPVDQSAASETTAAGRLEVEEGATDSQGQRQTMERKFATRLDRIEARLADLEGQAA